MNHEKVHKVIEFNRNAWLKPYIDMNVDLRRKNKKWFWKRFCWRIMTFLEKLGEMSKKKKTYKTCHNRKKKKVFGARTKVWYIL